MKCRGIVRSHKHESGYGDKDYIRIGIEDFGAMTIDVRVRPHEAKHYPIGRRVEVEIKPA